MVNSKTGLNLPMTKGLIRRNLRNRITDTGVSRFFGGSRVYSLNGRPDSHDPRHYPVNAHSMRPNPINNVLRQIKGNRRFFINIMKNNVRCTGRNTDRTTNLNARSNRTATTITMKTIINSSRVLLAITNFLITIIKRVSSSRILVTTTTTMTVTQTISHRALAARRPMVKLYLITKGRMDSRKLATRMNLMGNFRDVNFRLINPLTKPRTPPANNAAITTIRRKRNFQQGNLTQVSDTNNRINKGLRL